MSSIALLGAACGLGIWLIVHALNARTSLSDVGATLSAPGRPAMTPVTSSRTRVQQRLGSGFGAVEDIQGMSAFEQMCRHAAAHDSGANECDVR